MKRYANKDKTSPITHFAIESDRIVIWYTEIPEPYIYTQSKIGKLHLQELINRAISGRGLSTYINQNVKEKFIR
jgi:hypothetical protein